MKCLIFTVQAHPDVEDGVVPREVCIKEDEENDIYQACFQVENIRVKNCGDYYTYQLNPQVQDMAYCVYSEFSFVLTVYVELLFLNLNFLFELCLRLGFQTPPKLTQGKNKRLIWD